MFWRRRNGEETETYDAETGSFGGDDGYEDPDEAAPCRYEEDGGLMPKHHTNQTYDKLEHMFGDPKSKVDYGPLREEFIDWLSVPPSRRNPKTRVAMAQRLEVTEQTLRNWAKDPRIMSAVRAKISHEVTVNDLSDIVDTLKEQAFDPANPRSVQAAKLLFELIDRQVDEVSSVPLAEMPLDDLRKMAAELHDEFDERIDKSA